MKLQRSIAAFTLILFAAPSWGLTAAQKCQAIKLQAAGKYALCRLKAEAKAVKTGDVPGHGRCTTKFIEKWIKTEAAAQCPTEGDASVEYSAATTYTSQIAFRLSAAPRFVENGDGTITDRLTQLMWEKKSFGNVGATYVPEGMCSVSSTLCQPNAAAAAACLAGTENASVGCVECAPGQGACSFSATIWTWLADLNTANFAGHSDWRMPTLGELGTLLQYTATIPPIVDSALHGSACGNGCADVSDPSCSCTAFSAYWSASQQSANGGSYYHLEFTSGARGVSGIAGAHVRAVRGGL